MLVMFTLQVEEEPLLFSPMQSNMLMMVLPTLMLDTELEVEEVVVITVQLTFDHMLLILM